MANVWVAMNLEDGNRIAYVGSKLVACRVAAALVGNNSGNDIGEIVLYGPGDGTTSVMVRLLPAEWVGPADATDWVTCVKAVAASLSYNADAKSWKAGPWTDPSEPEGAGGVVEMIQELMKRLAK